MYKIENVDYVLYISRPSLRLFQLHTKTQNVASNDSPESDTMLISSMVKTNKTITFCWYRRIRFAIWGVKIKNRMLNVQHVHVIALCYDAGKNIETIEFFRIYKSTKEHAQFMSLSKDIKFWFLLRSRLQRYEWRVAYQGLKTSSHCCRATYKSFSAQPKYRDILLFARISIIWCQ